MRKAEDETNEVEGMMTWQRRDTSVMTRLCYLGVFTLWLIGAYCCFHAACSWRRSFWETPTLEICLAQARVSK